MRGLVLVFPGQGSQKVGMGADLRRTSPAAAARFDEASSFLGWDLGALCADGPADALQATTHAQPALYTASCAALDALRALAPIDPIAVAGHSVGEYAALYACGALEFAEGLALVTRRAALMQSAASEAAGAMAAIIGLDLATIRRLCEEAAGGVSIANLNCPGQVVISGLSDQVAGVSARCKTSGAKLVAPLAVSGGFHSSLMAGAAETFRGVLDEATIADPQIPFVANVTGDYCRTGAGIRTLLSAQIGSPVLWEPSMRRLLTDGMSMMMELGVGSVLSGLMRRIDRSVHCVVVEDGASLQSAAELLSTTKESVGGSR